MNTRELAIAAKLYQGGYTGQDIVGNITIHEVAHDLPYIAEYAHLNAASDLSDLNNATTARVNLGIVGIGGAWLNQASDLSDLNNATTARTNLGLGNVLNVVQLNQASDLSDLNNATTARTNIGLGNVTNDAQLKIASNLSDLNSASAARVNIELGISSAYPEQSVYGAVGDGSTNDTTALQACFNSGASLIYLTKNYKVGEITIPTSVKEIFGGGTVTQIATGAPAFSATYPENLSINHLTFSGVAGNAISSSDRAIYIFGGNNVHIKDCYLTGWRNYAIQVTNSSYVFIESNKFYACSFGVRFTGVIFGTISNNLLRSGQYTVDLSIPICLDSTDGHAYGTCQNISITGNNVSDWQWVQGILAHAGQRITVTGNNFYNVLTGISFNAFNTSDTIFNVSIIGNNVYSITSAESITGAGAPIVVSGYNSSYPAYNITINSNNTAYGNITTKDINVGGVNGAFISSGTITNNNINCSYSNGIVLNNPCNSVNIANNVVHNVAPGTSSEQNGIKIAVASDNIRISENIINIARYGVYFNAASYTGVEAFYNQFSGIGVANYGNESQSGITVTP